MNNKKICFVTSVHPALDVRIFYRQARALVSSGYDVTLIAQHDRNETVDGIKIVALPLPKNRFWRIMGTTFRVFREAIQQKADLYQIHDPELIPVGFLIKLFKRKKVVYDSLEDFPDFILLKAWIPKILRKPLSFLVDKLELAAARYFDAVITADAGVAARFQHKTTTVILHNFPELKIFGEVRSKPTDGSSFDIIYPGCLSRHLLSFMISVGSELKNLSHDFRWCVLGNISVEDENWVARELTRSNLSKNFVLVDRVDHTKVPEYIAQSKIGIAPLPAEKKFFKNIPQKVFEYMACGIPAVTSDLPPIRKFVKGKGCALLVEPYNVKAFTEALDSLLSDPIKANEMGNNGRRLIEEEYNWAVEEKKLLQLYAQLLENKKRRI